MVGRHVLFTGLFRGDMPGQLVIQTTNRCNASCPQCGMHAQARIDRASIPMAEMEKLIDHAAEQGFSAISFTGGEPFLDTGRLLTLIRRARDAGIPMIRTGTNGFMFRSWDRPDFEDRVKKLAENLVESSLRNFWISIDSHDPVYHERMRGLPGVIRGIEKALPIFHEAGLYPAANLGINRNVGGWSTCSLRPEAFDSQKDYLFTFSHRYARAFDRFYRFVLDLGFTMVNTCYPMSLPEKADDGDLKAAYAACADDWIVSFSAEEKKRLYTALLETIPRYRSRIRIFTPRCSLYALSRHDANTAHPSLYPCRGGRDFFYVRTPDTRTFPCGFRAQDDLGRFTSFSLSKTRRKSVSNAPCMKCDWECFRDPSELLGPLADLSHPLRLFKKGMNDPAFFKIWLKDLAYSMACDMFDGRRPPDHKKMARFMPRESHSTAKAPVGLTP